MGLQFSVTDNFFYYSNFQCHDKYFGKNIFDTLWDWMHFVACQRKCIDSTIPVLTGTDLIAQAISCQFGFPQKQKMQKMNTRYALRYLLPEVNKTKMTTKYIYAHIYVNSPDFKACQ